MDVIDCLAMYIDNHTIRIRIRRGYGGKQPRGRFNRTNHSKGQTHQQSTILQNEGLFEKGVSDTTSPAVDFGPGAVVVR